MDRIKRLNEIDFIWDTLELRWDDMFSDLQGFQKLNGHTDVPINGNSPLANWVSNQRKNFKSGELNLERKSQLDEIAFIWDVRQTNWKQNFLELASYVIEFGNTDVPIAWPGGLGTWVNSQRQKQKMGTLPVAEFQKLKELGFDWDRLGSAWDAMFKELLTYKAMNGHANVPQRPTTSLGRWVRGQRDSMKLGRLSADRKSELDAIGFEFNVIDSNWEGMFKELLAYKEQYSNTNVPITWSTHLGTWVSLQRKASKSSDRGAMTVERKARLDSIGFIWDASSWAWNENFLKLKFYQLEHGNLNVQNKYPSEFGDWISRQRSLYASGDLEPDRKERLQQIGFIWDANFIKWVSFLDELQKYKKEFGNTDVPQNWPTKLGRWVATQRSAEKNGTLADERKQRLADIGFSWRINKLL